MRIRRWYFLLVLAFAFLGLVGLALPAQEPPKQEPKADQQTASAKPGEAQPPAVPPDVLQKAKTYKGSATPPKDLKKADSHWSPYQLPEKPPEGAELYTIQPGDSLSLIAQKQMGNQYLWPQIWDLNPYIKDAHWIYPGDPLYIKKPQVVNEEVPVAQAVPPVAPEEPKTPKAPEWQIEEEAAMPPVSAYDVYCSGFITKDFKRPHLRIFQSFTPERSSLGKGDMVYLNEGEQEGVQAGQVFQVIFEGQIVHHPETGKAIGQFVRRLGQLKVVAVQPHTSIGEISQSCDEIVAGCSLIPYEVIPIPWDIKKSDEIPLQVTESPKPAGRIIWTEDRLGSVSQHNVVYVDLGVDSKLLPGDKLWVYRYPMKQGTLTQAVNDLYRQEKVDVPIKDLYRMPKPGAYEKKVTPAAGEGAEGGDLAAAGGEIVTPTPVETPVVQEKPPASPEQAIREVRQYLGEAVVLTVEKKTACLKLINSNKEIVIGDWVQIE